MKRKSISLFSFLMISLQLLSSQQLMIPRSSSKASISQAIGVTTVSLEYSRPSVKGREIIGTLAPYEKVWRAGANEATTIKFNHPISIEGKNIEAGIYGLFMIPRKGHRHLQRA